MKTSCIILARSGSKGIKNKNIINFCNKPLISWTILQAKSCKLVNDIWVSSDSIHILNIARKYNVKTILRPKNISQDHSTSEQAWIHALEIIKNSNNGKLPDYVLAPQVTSPLREPKDFKAAIMKVQKEKYDSLLSVSEIQDFFIWRMDDSNQPKAVNYDFKKRKRRQKIEKKFVENGSFYIFKPSILINNNNRIGGKISFYIMEDFKMHQIDKKSDIKYCETIMRAYKLNNL